MFPSLSLRPALCLSRLTPVRLSVHLSLSLSLSTICPYLYPPLSISVSLQLLIDLQPIQLLCLPNFYCALSPAIHLQTPMDARVHSYARQLSLNSAFSVSLFQFLIAHSHSFQKVELALDLVFVISAKYIGNICQHNFSHYTLLIWYRHC